MGLREGLGVLMRRVVSNYTIWIHFCTGALTVKRRKYAMTFLLIMARKRVILSGKGVSVLLYFFCKEKQQT